MKCPANVQKKKKNGKESWQKKRKNLRMIKCKKFNKTFTLHTDSLIFFGHTLYYYRNLQPLFIVDTHILINAKLINNY